MKQIERLSNPSEEELRRVHKLLNLYVSFGLTTPEMVQSLVNNHEVYVCRVNGSIEGVLTLVFREDGIQVRHLLVSLRYRRNGIASELLDAALHHNRKASRWLVEGWVTPFGWLAEQIFKKRGFHIVSHEHARWSASCHDEEDCPYYTGGCMCSSVTAVKIAAH